MLLSAVSVLVVAQSSSEIPEGLMNNPIQQALKWSDERDRLDSTYFTLPPPLTIILGTEIFLLLKYPKTLLDRGNELPGA